MNPAFRTAKQSRLVRTPAQWAKKLATLRKWSVLRRLDGNHVEQTFSVTTGAWDGLEIKVKGVARAAGRRADGSGDSGDKAVAKQLYNHLAAQNHMPLNGKKLYLSQQDYKTLIQQAIEQSLATRSLGAILIRTEAKRKQLIGPQNIDSPLSKEELVQVCRQKGIGGYSHMTKLELRKMLAAPDVLTNAELRQLCRLKGNRVPAGASREELMSHCLGTAPDGMYLGKGACPCSKGDFGKNEYKCSLTIPFGTEPKDSVDVYYLLFLASLVDSSVMPDPTPENLKHACSLVSAMLPSAKWLQQQQQYWQRLPDIQQKLMVDYTLYGDTIVNTFLRGERKKAVDLYIKEATAAKKLASDVIFGPFLVQNFTEDNLTPAGRSVLKRRYKGDLQNMKTKMGSWFETRLFSRSALELMLLNVAKAMERVIRSAPKLDKDTVVFRGITRADHIEATTTTRRDLISTSADYKVVWEFTYGKEPTVMHILLPKGSSVLAMLHSKFHTESEILLPPGTTLVTESCYSVKESLYTMKTGWCSSGYMNHCYAVART